MFGLSGLLPLLAVLGVASVGIGWYYTYTQDTIERLQKTNMVLEQVNSSNQEVITQLQETAAFTRQLNTQLQRKYVEAETSVDRLRDKLIEHDLTALSVAKPRLIETRINNGTNKAFDDLESVTALNGMQSVSDASPSN